MSRGGMVVGMEKSKELSFDEYEKKILDDQSVNMVALEFYRDLAKSFGWTSCHIQSRWGSCPSMIVKDISHMEVEFMFGDNKLRINFNRTIFVVPTSGLYKDAIKKIISVFDYVEGDDL